MHRLFLIAIALMVPVYAMAQTVVDTTVSAAPFVDTFLPFITAVTVALIGALTPFIYLYLQKMTGIKVDKENRDAFQTSLQNAAGLVIQRIGATAAQQSIQVSSPAMREAIQYVQKGAPGALKSWGLSPETIAQKIEAKVGVILNSGLGTETITVN